jgi:hypothetical protein
VEEIFRAENTAHYEGKTGEGRDVKIALKELDAEFVGIAGNEKYPDMVDEKVISFDLSIFFSS